MNSVLVKPLDFKVLVFFYHIAVVKLKQSKCYVLLYCSQPAI